MASDHQFWMRQAWGAAQGRVLADDVVHRAVASGTETTVSAEVEEFLGSIDQKGRGRVRVSKDDLTTVLRGDEFTFSGRRWKVTNINDNEDGIWDATVMTPQEIS